MNPQASRRRALLALAGSALVPLATAAAPGRVQVVGWLGGGRPSPARGLGKAMAGLGYVQDETLRFEVRSHATGGDAEALARLARELVAAGPDVMLAMYPYEITALLRATRTVPIVCGPIPDPVAAGFAHSLRRPGGTVTGLSTGSHEIWEIVIGLLRTLRPRLKRIVVVHAPGMPVPVQMSSHRAAAQAAGIDWSHAPVASVADVERALAPAAGEAIHFAPIAGEEVASALLETAHRQRTLTFGGPRGCLMAYSRHYSDMWARLATILDKVLRGADPAGLPFELPDRTHFVVNRATARRIGVVIPPDMLLRANEVLD